jgi:putative oxidoreductase
MTRYLPFIGRLLLAAIYLISGVMKVADPAGTKAYIVHAGLPAVGLAYIISVVVEVIGGVLLVVGYKARAVAAVFAIYTLVAAVGFHNNLSDPEQMVNFWKNVAIAGGFLQIVAFGAGAISVDKAKA